MLCSNHSLLQAIRKYSSNTDTEIQLVVIPLGVAGTVYTSAKKLLKESLGVLSPALDTLLRNLHLHAVRSLNVIRYRRIKMDTRLGKQLRLRSCHSSSYTSTSNSTPREKSCGVSCIKDLQQAAALHTRLCQRDSACLSATPLSLPAACQQARLLLKTNLSSNNVLCCVHLQHGSNLPLLRQLSITLQDAGWAAAHMQLCISLHAFLFQIASRHPTNLHRCAAVLQSACHQAMQLSAMATAAPASCSLPAAARSLSSAAPPHQSAVCQRCTCPWVRSPAQSPACGPCLRR